MTMSLPSRSNLLPVESGGIIPPAIYVKLNADIIDKILDGQRNLSLSFGSKMEFRVNGAIFPAFSNPEASHVDLFKSEAKSSEFRNIGKITHRLTVSRSLREGASAASRLKSQNKSIQQEKEANKATLIEQTSDPRKRSTLIANGISRPSTPVLSSGNTRSLTNSPILSAISKPKMLPISASKPITLHSSTMRLLHLLALKPTTAELLSARTSVSLAEAQAFVSEYATKIPDSDGLVRLADNKYSALRIWEWKYYSDEEREAVIKDAIKAFDRLKLPTDHANRRALLDPKIRKEQKEREDKVKKEERERKEEVERKERQQKKDEMQINYEQRREELFKKEESKVLDGPISRSSTPVGTKRVGAILKTKSPAKKPKISNSSSSPPRVDTQSPSLSPSPNKLDALTSKKSNKVVKSSEYVLDSDSDEPMPLTPVTSGSSTTTPRGSSSFKTKTATTTLTTSTAAATAAAPIVASPKPIVGTSKPGSPAIGISKPGVIIQKRKVKPKTPTTVVTEISSKAVKSSSPMPRSSSEDMFELAKRFKETYSEYERLFNTLSKTSPGSRKGSLERQRLISLHKDLESWKRKLWASSGQKGLQGVQGVQGLGIQSLGVQKVKRREAL